mmetsp:Transcript_147339/g.274538  ORF Transcript_147339/g.274538 Transcript_147339/m.274538 type:complete len:307 (-) Transcript_147339:18-938(-)
MHFVVVVLSCLASLGHARKVHLRAEVHTSAHESTSLRTLAKLFLASSAAAAFNPAVPRATSLAANPSRPAVGPLESGVSKLAPRVRMSTAEGVPDLLPGGTKDWQVAVQKARERAAAVKGLNEETFSAAAVFALALFVLSGFPVYPLFRDLLGLVVDLVSDQLKLAFDFGPVFYAGVLGAYGYSQEGTPFGDVTRTISKTALAVAGKEGGKKEETLATVGIFALVAFVLTGFPLISGVLDLVTLVVHLIGDQFKLFFDVGLIFYAALGGLYCGYFRQDQLGDLTRTAGRFGLQAKSKVQELIDGQR